MRNKDRIDDVLKRLGDVWKEFPDMRLGQIILNVIQDPYLYYIEDEKLIEIIEEFYKQIKEE